MCSERIHQRLGLVKTNGKTKTPIRDILAEAIKDLSRHRPAWADLINKAKHILDLIDAWLKHMVLFRLRNIIDATYDLCHSAIWKNFKASMPPLDIQAGRIDRLVRAVDKLSRYKEVARYLYRTAKRYPVARLVRVRVVDLPSMLFERPPPENYVVELSRAFERIRVDKQTLGDVCILLDKRLPKAKASFNESMKASRDRPVMHAEVQLLTYFDIKLQGTKPRVICSSKEACFLCNFLIKTHGKMYTPYTHGRVYRGWRLPAVRGDKLANELNFALQGSLKESLTWMRRENKRIKNPLPGNESASHTLILSSTTLAESGSSLERQDEGPIETQGLASVVSEIAVSENPEAAKNSNSISDAAVPYSSPADPAPSAHERATTPAANSINLENAEETLMSEVKQKSSDETNVRTTTTGQKRTGHIFHQGTAISTTLAFGRDNTQLFVFDSFDLLVDRSGPSASPSGAQSPPKRLSCDISWIAAEETSHVLEQGRAPVVDMSTLGEITLPLQGHTTFFLRDGDRCMLRVSIDGEISALSSPKNATPG